MVSASLLNSGNPYETLISQIVAIERQPQLRLKMQKGDQETYKGVLSDFDSKMSALNTTLKDFTDAFATPFAVRTSSISKGVGASVSVKDTAALGTHSLNVERLASTDARYSRQYDATGNDLRSFFDTNGAQDFTINVASPTADDADRRVAVSVSVDPAGTTNAEIMDEISTAISDAMKAAVGEDGIKTQEKATASDISETTVTSRLTLRSGASGFAGRMTFADSADGLLAALEVTRDAVIAPETTTTVTSPATEASFSGQQLSVPITIDNSNRNLDIEINGVEINASLSQNTYLSIDDLAADINTQLGGDVTVGVDNDALTFTTTATGSTASLQVIGGNSLSTLGLSVMANPVTGEDETTETQTIERGGYAVAPGTNETDSALNAKFTLDGLTLYRSTNSVSDALDGVTLDLKQTDDPTEFSVDTDNKEIKDTVNDFIKKYNDVLDFIAKKTGIDAESETRGALAEDSTVRSLRFSLRSHVSRDVTGLPTDAVTNLRDLGLEIADDGKLSLKDATKLYDAVADNADAVHDLFSGDDGIATRVQAEVAQFVGTDGIIDQRKDVVDKRVDRLEDRIATWDTRLESRANQLRQEFARLQEVTSMFQSQSAHLSTLLYQGYY